MIEVVTPDTMIQAARIYSESWKDSHKAICSPDFLALYTPEHQKVCLEAEFAKGMQIYMLTEGKPVGIVSVRGSLIAHLYILPGEQNKGYGTQLLRFAIDHCMGSPTLWIVNTNDGARRLYERNGFRLTGNCMRHTDAVYELELRLC